MPPSHQELAISPMHHFLPDSRGWTTRLPPSEMTSKCISQGFRHWVSWGVTLHPSLGGLQGQTFLVASIGLWPRNSLDFRPFSGKGKGKRRRLPAPGISTRDPGIQEVALCWRQWRRPRKFHWKCKHQRDTLIYPEREQYRVTQKSHYPSNLIKHFLLLE